MRPRSQAILAETLEDYLMQLSTSKVIPSSDSTLLQLYNFDSLSLNHSLSEDNSIDLLSSNVSYRIKFKQATEKMLGKATKRIVLPLKVRRAQRKKRGLISSLSLIETVNVMADDN